MDIDGLDDELLLGSATKVNINGYFKYLEFIEQLEDSIRQGIINLIGDEIIDNDSIVFQKHSEGFNVNKIIIYIDEGDEISMDAIKKLDEYMGVDSILKVNDNTLRLIYEYKYN